MLVPLATDLWTVDNDLFLPGGFHFPGRMTVVRLPSGGLLLHAPVPIDEALGAALHALGPVEHIVSPCLFHHLFVWPAAARYPAATVWGPDGLARKRRDLSIHKTLGADRPDWADIFSPTTVQGIPILNETVFLHRQTRTLVTTDLVFNIRRWRGWQTSVLLWIVGARGRLAQSRSVRFMTRDAAAAAESARQILALDFDRLVMAHGDIVETGGHAALQGALGRMAGQPRLAAAGSASGS